MTTTTAPATAAVPAPPGRRRSWLLPTVVAVALVAGLVLRFVAFSPLWLDESQTVAIASRSFSGLFAGLRVDGSPPLYYLLLHVWMLVFGTSTFAVRALSGLLSVASLGLMPLVARRLGWSRRGALTATLLLATNPFAVRYATEARMYSMVLLLSLLLLLAIEGLYRSGGRWPVAATALITAGLLLTHYWSLFFYGVGVLATAWLAWRRGDRGARRVLLALLLGAIPFLPWLPTFAFQTLHTGAPWGSPPTLATALLVLTDWTGAGTTGVILWAACYLLLALALFGQQRSRTPAGIVAAGTAGEIRLSWPPRRLPATLLTVTLLGLVVGCLAGAVLGSAYASRYSTIAMAPVLLVVAAGTELLGNRWRTTVVAALCVLGLVGCAGLPGEPRTQAKQIAAEISHAPAGSVILFCPDQLAPAVHRLAPNVGRQVTYPNLGSPDIVNWVDYVQRIKASRPLTVARRALALAGPHPIYLVYADDYMLFTDRCTRLLTHLAAARGAPRMVVQERSNRIEHSYLALFRGSSTG